MYKRLHALYLLERRESIIPTRPSNHLNTATASGLCSNSLAIAQEHVAKINYTVTLIPEYYELKRRKSMQQFQTQVEK